VKAYDAARSKGDKRGTWQCVGEDGKDAYPEVLGAFEYAGREDMSYHHLAIPKSDVGPMSPGNESAYRTKMNELHQTVAGFCAPYASQQEQVGKKVFCQWYDSKLKKSWMAAEYTLLQKPSTR
jgi:hypothetical protein